MSQAQDPGASRRLWYRNATGRHYHEAGPDWVRTGMSSCGRRIARAGFVVKPGDLLRNNFRACQDCLRVAARYE